MDRRPPARVHAEQAAADLTVQSSPAVPPLRRPYQPSVVGGPHRVRWPGRSPLRARRPARWRASRCGSQGRHLQPEFDQGGTNNTRQPLASRSRSPCCDVPAHRCGGPREHLWRGSRGADVAPTRPRHLVAGDTPSNLASPGHRPGAPHPPERGRHLRRRGRCTPGHAAIRPVRVRRGRPGVARDPQGAAGPAGSRPHRRPELRRHPAITAEAVAPDSRSS